MVFSSLVFVFFYLTAVLAVYYLAPLKLRLPFLLLANLVFYGWGEPVYVLLMVYSTVLDYSCGRYVERHRGSPRARRGLAISLIGNLGILFFFKYTDFFLSTFNSLFRTRIPLLGLPLPIGISFYTFQTMSYTIDVYRGKTDAQKNIFTFGAYVSLFPQLIAGPIVRYCDVSRQLEKPACSTAHFAAGVRRFTLGLVKKLILANGIGRLWEQYESMPFSQLSVLGAWLGAAAFSLQLYFDFSGYSDMAIGLGRMLGFDFPENFNYPYTSRSVTEFWRRWHMTLGSWFREYVYFPLGGNRKGSARTLLNIFITWTLTGFWHGANWNFLLWGVYNSLLLILERAFLLKRLEKAPPVLSHLLNAAATVFGMAIFCNDDPGRLFPYLGSMLGAAPQGIASADLFYLRNYAGILILGVLASTPVFRRLFSRIPEKLRHALQPVLLVTALAVCTAYLVDASYNPFLYFRF